MNKNLGTLERFFRIALGIALVGGSLTGLLGDWGWVGIVPIATGLVGFCPLYKVCGCKRCAAKQG